MTTARSVAVLAVAASLAIGAVAFARQRARCRTLLAAVARPARHRRFRRPRRRRPNGARRRTFAGRSRFPAAARRRPSSGATGCSSCRPCRSASPAMRRTRARGGQPLVPHKFMVMALDRKTGKVVWERVAKEQAPHEASHPENGTWASASAATDGEHIIASFDSFGYYAYDMNGKLVWEKDLGDKQMRNTFGEGSTPALYRQSPRRPVGSPGPVVRRRFRQAHRAGDLAPEPHRDRHVGDAARRSP